MPPASDKSSFMVQECSPALATVQYSRLPKVGHLPKAFFIYPDDDHNDAFAVDDYVCHRLLGIVELYPDTTLVHVSTVTEAMKLLKSLPDNSVKHLAVGGHGSATSLNFGSCESTRCALKIYTPSADEFWRLAKTKLVDDGRILLDACKNGNNARKTRPDDDLVPYNHQNYVASRVPGHKVYASRVSYGSTEFVLRDFQRFDLLVRSDSDNSDQLDDNKSYDGTQVVNYVSVGNCVASPVGWMDKDGRSCRTYAKHGLCYKMGDTKSADGVAAEDACCECGGGSVRADAAPLRCPPFAKETPEGGRCTCREAEAECYHIVSDKSPGCKNGGSFAVEDGSQFECRTSESCPTRSHAEYFYESSQDCMCDYGMACFIGNRSSAGCPAHGGEVRTDRFDPKSCSDCTCKPVSHELVKCSNGICTCPEHMTCFKGSRDGHCPTDPDYAERLASGPVAESTTQYAESCEFCKCRAPCKGLTRDDQEWSDNNGECECEDSDDIVCMHDKDKTVKTLISWGMEADEAEAMGGIKMGHEGDCPMVSDYFRLSETYIDMYKCPDCYCAKKD
eukprot:TRINITY_DN1927_c1_g1_i5.p1 TRINITY_DN1927_c1_g1~~TRINITY_DN1927_c1_g1_i5.p1  ORF type:complete len:562 (+),score=69.33 TRINITY_DN1927_c1_g1_i5:109-1794(+)